MEVITLITASLPGITLWGRVNQEADGVLAREMSCQERGGGGLCTPPLNLSVGNVTLSEKGALLRPVILVMATVPISMKTSSPTMNDS